MCDAFYINFWNPYQMDFFKERSTCSEHIWTELNPQIALLQKINLPSASALIKKTMPAILVVHTEFIKYSINTKKKIIYEQHPWDNFFKFFDPSNKYKNYSKYPPRKTEGQASGFIIHPSGLALTNQHVIENAERIIIKAGNGLIEFEAKIIGEDKKTDIALIKVQSSLKKWPTIPLGNSCNLRVGDFAMAIGSPLGLELSVSMGIVSACERAEIIPSGRYGIYNFIQFDAPINPGNSGGPLINLVGEVVGINTATSTVGQGIGFAIPIDQVKQILPQLKKK